MTRTYFVRLSPLPASSSTSYVLKNKHKITIWISNLSLTRAPNKPYQKKKTKKKHPVPAWPWLHIRISRIHSTHKCSSLRRQRQGGNSSDNSSDNEEKTDDDDAEKSKKKKGKDKDADGGGDDDDDDDVDDDDDDDDEKDDKDEKSKKKRSSKSATEDKSDDDDDADGGDDDDQDQEKDLNESDPKSAKGGDATDDDEDVKVKVKAEGGDTDGDKADEKAKSSSAGKKKDKDSGDSKKKSSSSIKRSSRKDKDDSDDERTKERRTSRHRDDDHNNRKRSFIKLICVHCRVKCVTFKVGLLSPASPLTADLPIFLVWSAGVQLPSELAHPQELDAPGGPQSARWSPAHACTSTHHSARDRGECQGGARIAVLPPMPVGLSPAQESPPGLRASQDY